MRRGEDCVMMYQGSLLPRPVATAVLYRSVVLWNAAHAVRFLHTLSTRPDLATLVQYLAVQIGWKITRDMNVHGSTDDSQNVVQILA